MFQVTQIVVRFLLERDLHFRNLGVCGHDSSLIVQTLRLAAATCACTQCTFIDSDLPGGTRLCPAIS
jgi:hypothetical protein